MMENVKWSNGLLMLVPVLMFLGQPLHAAEGPPPANVVVSKVTQQEVAQTRSVIGVLYYERVSDVSTEVAGLVESVKVSQGDHVKQGDTLVELNTEILDQEIALTRTRIEQAELRIANTRKNFKRLEKIYNQAGVSEKDYDDAEYSYQDAQKDKQANQDSLNKLLIQKKRSVITAPFDGIILTKDVDSGAWVQQGKQLVSLGSSEDLYVRAPIAENMLQYIEIGGSVPVTITAFGGESAGTVTDIDPVADVKTKNIFLKIKIAPLPLVAQNMSASVYVPASEKQELRILPRAAVVKFQGKDFVYTVKEGKASILPINIVTFMGESVAVDNPYIAPGMGVVVEGNERLRPDQPVTIAGEK
jgi:RND family efflux transporter MFP subunit